MMNKKSKDMEKPKIQAPISDGLFNRVVTILEQAGSRVVQAVNSEMIIAEDDNPTIGLILCSEKNEAIARYSVLNNSKQLFASKYMLYLPTEKELEQELERERRLIEEKHSKRENKQ